MALYMDIHTMDGPVGMDDVAQGPRRRPADAGASTA